MAKKPTVNTLRLKNPTGMALILKMNGDKPDNKKFDGNSLMAIAKALKSLTTMNL